MKNKGNLSGAAAWTVSILALVSLLVSCKDKSKAEAAAGASAAVAASGPPPGPVASAPGTPRRQWQVPSGPRFGIFAGQGIGPIRIGATVATIERHMEAPCELKTEDACRYVARAVEFILKDGVTSEIRIHRKDRVTTPKPMAFGIFNGRFPQGAQFFMLPAAVHEMIGAPKKIEAVKEGGEWNTAEIHHYDGMRLEFDRMDNGNLVLGGVIIRK